MSQTAGGQRHLKNTGGNPQPENGRSPIYSHNPLEGGAFPLLVLDVARQVCTPSNEGFRVLHWHEEVQFIRVLQGVIQTRVYEEEIEVHAGDCLFINRMVPHKTIEKEDCRYHSFIIPEQMLGFFPGSIMEKKDVESFLYHPGFTHFLIKKAEPSHSAALNELKTLDNLYFSSSQKTKPHYEYLLSTSLVSLWLAFISALPPLPTAAAAPSREHLRIRELLTYLHSHYRENLSVESIAAAAHISKTECLRCFHRYVGESPYQYLIKYRLHMSEALLKDTELSVTEISSETGFASASSYIRYFRRWYGCTPKEYRTAQKNSSSSAD